MNGRYILDGKNPVVCENILEWAKQMGSDNRIVEQSQFGDVKVSTVFLGLDHSFGGEEPLNKQFDENDPFGEEVGYIKPILFETMIFGGENDQYQERYSTWDEAVEGHKKACDLVSLGYII